MARLSGWVEPEERRAKQVESAFAPVAAGTYHQQPHQEHQTSVAAPAVVDVHTRAVRASDLTQGHRIGTREGSSADGSRHRRILPFVERHLANAQLLHRDVY